VYCLKKSSSATGGDDDDKHPDLKIVGMSGLKRSMKEANLTASENQKCEFFQEFASDAWEYAYKTDNVKDALLYLEHYTARWPEDFICSINYANMIRDGISSSEGNVDISPNMTAAVQGGRRKKPEEAWRILTRTEPYVDPNWDQINQFRYAMAVTACDSHQPPHVALDWALKMTKETPNDRAMVECAIRDVIELVRGNNSNVDERNTQSKLEVNKKACYALLELLPDSAEVLSLVAGAECLLGRNEEGARIYRKALETGELNETNVQEVKENLALAQMQREGGPLEHYDVLNQKDGKCFAIHKRHAGKYLFVHEDGVCCVQPLEGANLSASDMLEQIDIPDPDDEKVFGNV